MKVAATRRMRRGTRCRRGRPLVLGLVLLLLLPALLGTKRPKGLGDVLDVRTWSYRDYTRVVVELSREVDLSDNELTRLAANSRKAQPERLYVDLSGIWVGRKYVKGVPVGDGLLEAVRLGQNTLRTTRLVIDLERYERHRMFTLQAPHRVVIDVYGRRRKDDSVPSREAKVETKQPETGLARRLSMALRPLHTVVIDPGHGGKDPGAIGVGGVREKDVNLKLSKLLARRLRARSFRVVMTRETDKFIDLEERTAIAESAGGDVFVSLHANAARRRHLRGIEIYYLDEAHKRHSLDVAARENGVDARNLDTLQRTLARLRIAEASTHSRRLAEHVHADVTQGLSRTYRNIPDLGIKKGPFYVLFMSSMPAILVESGFLSNRSDAALLKSERYLDTLAAQIAAGLGHYRLSDRQLTAQADRTGRSLPPVGAGQ